MALQNAKKLLNRQTLKNYFRRGRMPTEENFTDLIESMVNKQEDGFSKSLEDGLVLAPQGNSKKVMSFYENMKNPESNWHFALNPTHRIQGLSIGDNRGDSRFFISKEGNVGISQVNPEHTLDVNGMVGMKGRIGTHAIGEVPADKKWHNILTGLDDLQAFEVMAEVRGIRGRGQYGLLHATALSAFGGRGNKIRKTHARFGMFWNKLSIRWFGDVHNYHLQVRSRTNYGNDLDNNQIMIKYRVARLWGQDAPNLK
jgi:hypothetical protein